MCRFRSRWLADNPAADPVVNRLSANIQPSRNMGYGYIISNARPTELYPEQLVIRAGVQMHQSNTVSVAHCY